MKSTRLKKVAIIGRPNVGKSTLFNRLVQQRISITSDISGTTRDRITFPVEWLNRTFSLIDTGGFTNKLNEDNFQKLINIQVEFAIKEADLIIFLISKEGITTEELQISKKLKQSKKPIILAINKVDNIEQKNNLDNFYKLGIETQIPISSIHGIGISTLLDAIINELDLVPSTSDYFAKNRIGIIGKPNVGKSTLINALLKDQRVIVSDIPGTTRDSIDTKITYYNKEYIFTDTAGLKKNKKALDDIEFYSELRTNFAISNSEIIVLMVDPIQGINKIDEQILQILKEQYKPTIIAINKIDSVDALELKEFKSVLLEEFKFFNDPYIIEISSLTSKNLTKIFDAINRIQIALERKISISEINNFLIDIQTIKKVPRHNGINIRLTYMTYSNNSFPHFIIFSNYPQYVHFSYERFIINNLKKIYDFKGIPIKITFKKNI